MTGSRATIVLLLLAIVLAFVTLFGDNSYERLVILRDRLVGQERQNTELKEYVENLQDEVYRIQTDDRALEKAARNELGMARPDELIFVFEKDREKDHAKRTTVPTATKIPPR
jgi:cell division protein FtsB